MLGLLFFLEGWVVNELLFRVARVGVVFILQVKFYEGTDIRSRFLSVLAPDS